MLTADGGGGAAPAGVGAGMASLGQQMASFRDAATSGQFSVNDAGGKALLGAIQEMQDWLGPKLRDVRNLNQTGQYGTSHGAGVVEPYMNNVATDSDGLTPMLEKFQTVLNDASEAIKKAMGNYRQTEAGNTGDVRRAGGDSGAPANRPGPVPMPHVLPPGSTGGVQVV